MVLLTVRRRPYVRRDGTPVKGSMFKVKDRGARGKTPKRARWFHPTVHTGWRKELSQRTRINKVVEAHGGDLLAAARSLTALANVTTDRETKTLARQDAKVLYSRYAK